MGDMPDDSVTILAEDGPCMAAEDAHPLSAWRRYRATRPHLTVRISRALTRLRLYRPVMRLLHRWGQCFMVSNQMEDGLLRHCTWCGNRHHNDDGRAAEASLRAAAGSGSAQ